MNKKIFKQKCFGYLLPLQKKIYIYNNYNPPDWNFGTNNNVNERCCFTPRTPERQAVLVQIQVCTCSLAHRITLKLDQSREWIFENSSTLCN